MITYKTNPEIFEAKSEVLKALAHPVRLCIVKNLLEFGKSNVSSMQICLEAPQSTISQHLSKLKAVNIIKAERKGVEIYYSVMSKEAKKVVNSIFIEEKMNKNCL